MKLTPFIFATGFLLGIANAADQGTPDAPGYPGYGNFQPAPHAGRPAPRGLGIERGANEQGYYLRIHLGGLESQAVRVTPVGRSLVISTSQSLQSERRHAPQQSRPGYRQWSYSTHRSSGAMQRRISVPRDADIEAMQRTDSEAVILITLPRSQGALPHGRYD
jgi:HSP20 family molecular chaperone IbpA